MDRVLPEAVLDVIGASIDFVYQFAPLAEKTVVLVPSFVGEKVAILSEASGQDVDTLNYLLGMLLCYPLGIIMNLLPYGKVKHLFSLILGAFLLQFTIGKQWIHQLISSMLAYIMFMILPAKDAKFWVPVMTMVYITLGHLHRQYVNYLGWDMDFTGPQMVLTMKLYSLAFNLWDGEQLAKGNPDRAGKKCAPLAVPKLPGIIEFLGYTFCFSNVLAGPAYEYKVYQQACDGTHLYDENGKPRGKIPSQILPTLKPFLVSIVCLGLFSVGGGMFPVLNPTDPQKLTPAVLSEEALANPLWKRYLLSWIALACVRQKYYFAWKNAEGANNIWYAGFEGFDEKGEAKGWENSVNIDILDFEFAPNIKLMSAAWNKKTANWLGRYIYMRTGGNLMATYGMSAFWHGFYPGYYLFFMSLPLVTACERLGRKKLTPRFAKFGIAYNIVCILATTLTINSTLIMAFQLLSWDWAIAYTKSFYFMNHIICIVFYLVVSQLPSVKKDEKKTQ